jgi:hypothetical protein
LGSSCRKSSLIGQKVPVSIFFLLIPNELRTGGAGLMTSPPSWKRLIIGLHFCGF